jgi:hypothetical protein
MHTGLPNTHLGQSLTACLATTLSTLDHGCGVEHHIFYTHKDDEEGAYVIEDLGSTNGTFVNDVKVRGRQTLTEHDTIRFGTGRWVGLRAR